NTPHRHSALSEPERTCRRFCPWDRPVIRACDHYCLHSDPACIWTLLVGTWNNIGTGHNGGFDREALECMGQTNSDEIHQRVSDDVCNTAWTRSAQFARLQS